VGSNDLTTTFSGVIQDGGAGGGTGGSLTKLGRGYLTLTSANTYTGGTIINDGKLTVNNTTGSGTGPGPVQDPGGNLTGNGIVAGAVTVGGVNRTIAVLAPGSRQAATFTIQGSLTFAVSGNYDWSFAGNLRRVRFDQVFADGVVINDRTGFNFFPSGTLGVGTVLTVINNTSASPIAGTFSNLADGAIITTNGGKFQANYEGGDGNDLTLTVVP
jgi:autotransporter-associated beta strand protein